MKSNDMKTNKLDLSCYAIDPSKGRKYEDITYVLALIYNALQAKVSYYLSKYDLSVVQFNMLVLIAYYNKGKGLNQVDISKHLIASASNITKLVEKSVKAELLTRKTNPQSRRENIVCITKKGQELIDEVWPGYDNLVRNLTEKIPVKHRSQTEQTLKNWLFSLQQEK